MKKKVSIILIISFSFLILSCGKISPEGNIEIKNVNVSDFKNLDLKGKFRLFYVKGDKNFVEIETYPNFYKNLKIEVEDNTLNIHELRETKGIGFYNVTVYSKDNLHNIAITDSVEMNVSSEIKSDNLTLNIKKSGKFIGSLNAKKTNITMIGNSLANFKGATENATIKISDSASIIAPYWFINNLEIHSQNNSYAETNVRDSIKGKIQQNAKFLYYNEPIRAFTIEKNAIVTNKKLD